MKQRLAADVTRRLAADGFTDARVALGWEADLRHEGQATELTVHYDGDDLGEMAARFVAEYLKTYGYEDESPIELVKLRVVGRGLRERRLDFKQLAIESRAGAPDRALARHPLRPRRRRHRYRGRAALRAAVLAPPGSAGDRGIRLHHRRPARRQRAPRCHGQHRSGPGGSSHESRSHHVRRHQERARLDRRRHGLHGGAHRPLGDRQGRDGFLGRALCAADGQMVAQAKTIAQHLGAIPEAMAAVLAKFGDDLIDGDAVIMNDPYHGGMHLPDIFMFMPLFFGGKRRAFAVVICHHTDVGGRVPGSNASDSTEIYQEGLRIPPLKLYDRGVLNETLATMIKINVRVPDRVWGDLSAQYAAAQVGKRGLEKLFQRYGADEVEAYMARAARLRRAADARGDQDVAQGPLRVHRPHRQRRLLRHADPHQGRHHGARRRHAAGRLHGLLPASEGRAQLHAQLHALAHLSQRALRAAEGRAQQRRACSAASR